MSYLDKINEDVRLIILKGLYMEPDYTLNGSILTKILREFGHNKTREYVHNQLVWLRDNACAVTIKPAGTILVATLTEAGQDHVEKRTVLTGIERPSATD